MFFNRIGQLFTILFFGFMVLCGSVKADETDLVNVQPALWQVKRGDGTVYLLGSFHLLPKNYQWFDGIISQSFNRAQELVMEAKMTPEATAAIQGMVIQNAFFKPQDNLQNYLDDVHYDKMLKQAKNLMGMDEETARKMKPWFMALQISIISIMSSGMDPDSGVDRYLEDLARKSAKTISGLETPEQSMNALIKHPMSVQAALLADTLDKLDDFMSYINNYLEAWASGDGDRMVKTMVEDMAEQPEMYDAMLVSRNKNWLPAIERYINGGRTIFIVVGAAHLVGQDGIVKMLEARGYRVDKIQ
ncbi:MAG: hypothetical protein COB49_03600 [Alphaproteobacteria bacterium]|nr:MAG: hypothetical protein COB49_03600 [Alphaproteobacteria bacterium]